MHAGALHDGARRAGEDQRTRNGLHRRDECFVERSNAAVCETKIVFADWLRESRKTPGEKTPVVNSAI